MQEKYRNAFLGYGPEDTNFCLELTENYDKDNYDLGTGFGHFALALPDVYKTCESIKKAGELHTCMNHDSDQNNYMTCSGCMPPTFVSADAESW